MKTMRLTVARVGETLFDGEARQITCPGSEGAFTALPSHEPFVTTLKEGSIRVINDEGREEVFEVESGVFETSGESATVLL